MTGTIVERVAAAVDADRLSRRHEALAAIGGLQPSGLSREAYTEADFEARRLVVSWAEARGYLAFIDPIGNMFFRRADDDRPEPPLVIGSHIDSQPAGGPYDGQFGVLAAWETVEALEDAGAEMRVPLEVAIWANEEGSRFQPTTMGSAVFAGRLPLEEALGSRDTQGRTVGQELSRLRPALSGVADRPLGFPIAAFLEAHIEQGPILERHGTPIGVVTSIQGLRWFTVEVTGSTGHAGTTPVADRRDAFVAATEMAAALRELMDDPGDTVRFTIGRFEVRPNAPNTIPGSVLFTIDFRHPDQEVLRRLGDQVEPICRARAGGCEVVVRETLDAPPTALDPAISRAISQAATALGIAQEEITSGATHDAKYLAMVCPTGMVFVPCRNGISHSVLEHVEPEQMTLGTRVLAGATARLLTDAQR